MCYRAGLKLTCLGKEHCVVLCLVWRGHCSPPSQPCPSSVYQLYPDGGRKWFICDRLTCGGLQLFSQEVRNILNQVINPQESHSAVTQIEAPSLG